MPSHSAHKWGYRSGTPWSAAEVRNLGKVPDSVFALRHGRTLKEVVAERYTRGIGLPTGPRRWTAREIRLLGKLNDREVSRRLRRPINQVWKQRTLLGIPSYLPAPKQRRWTPAQRRLLGTAPDAVVARRLGRPLRSNAV
jgi:hypothetical protein